jgi:hypothetical protein
LGIVRCPVECPGCKTGIVLRLGVGHEKRQPFFYVCPKCQAATKGALHWNGGAKTRLELADGRKLPSEERCTEAVSINPEIPAFATARSMAEPGGSAFLTFYQWLGPDGILQYQRAFYQMRHFVQSDCKRLSRLATYYLNRDWHHYDRAVRQLLPSGESNLPAELKRDHEIHHLYEIFFGPMWALHPGKHSMEMKVGWNALWSPDRRHFKELVSFAQVEVETPAFTNIQRDLFDQLARYVDLLSAMFPGLLCDLLPDKYQPEIDKLRLFRDDYEMLRDLYIQSFETSHKVLRWIIGAVNATEHGDPDKFVPVPGMNPEVVKRLPKNLNAFARLTSANKSEWLPLFPDWQKHWHQLLDRQLRNDIGHASARHQLPTGLIERDGRPSLPYTRFVQKTHRILYVLLGCTNALKIMRIYAAMSKSRPDMGLRTDS